MRGAEAAANFVPYKTELLVDPYVWFVVGAMATFAIVLGVTAMLTRGQ